MLALSVWLPLTNATSVYLCLHGKCNSCRMLGKSLFMRMGQS